MTNRDRRGGGIQLRFIAGYDFFDIGYDRVRRSPDAVIRHP